MIIADWGYLALEKVGLSVSERNDNFFDDCGEILSHARPSGDINWPAERKVLNIKYRMFRLEIFSF